MHVINHVIDNNQMVRVTRAAGLRGQTVPDFIVSAVMAAVEVAENEHDEYILREVKNGRATGYSEGFREAADFLTVHGHRAAAELLIQHPNNDAEQARPMEAERSEVGRRRD